MSAYPLRAAALTAVAAIGLSGCAYNGLYSGVSVGVGNGYYGDYGYGGYGYGAAYPGYGYGSPYFGWYDGFYYPGTGFYVYDRYRRPHRWTDAQRRYWRQRHDQALASGFRQIATNWSEFDRSGASTRQIQTRVGQPVVTSRGIDRPDRTRVQMRSERSFVRAQRSEARDQRQSSARTERQGQSRGRARDNVRDD